MVRERFKVPTFAINRWLPVIDNWENVACRKIVIPNIEKHGGIAALLIWGYQFSPVITTLLVPTNSRTTLRLGGKFSYPWPMPFLEPTNFDGCFHTAYLGKVPAIYAP